MEESNLIRFFGGSPFLRILDALMDNLGESYTKKELQETAGVSKGAFFAHWPKFEELGLVKSTRVIGKTRLFTLDRANPLVKDLLRLEMRLIERTAPEAALVNVHRTPKKSPA